MAAPGDRRDVEIGTEYGPASADLDEPTGMPAFLLVLTHGSAGGVESLDLLAVRDVAVGLGGVVARVIQPYRRRGARAPGSAERQDAAWLEIIAALRARFPGLRLVQGGRSNGARVACRTARAAAASGVLALAFPLHPPGRPERSRAGELQSAGTSVLVLNGSRDPFGVPHSSATTTVVVLPDEAHALTGDPGRVAAEAGAWLGAVLGLAV